MAFPGFQPKYIPKLWLTVVYLVLVAGAFILFMGRTKEYLRMEFLMTAFPGFYTHVSNFSITLLLYAITGYLWLMQGAGMKSVLLLGGVLVAVNFMYELLLPVINTMDLTDAYYGLAGAVVGAAFLMVARKYGFTENPQFKGKEI